MNIVDDVASSRFLLIVMDEGKYMEQLHEIVKSVDRAKNSICYVCLSRPYEDVESELKKNKIKTGNFTFIDVLSSHYERPAPRKNCIFLDSPDNLDAIREAIVRAAGKEKFSVILLDTVSALLIYQEIFPILRFTNSLASEKEQENVKKVFIVLKNISGAEKEGSELIDDLKMFADKTLDMGV